MTFNASDLILSSSGIMVTKPSAGSCKLCGARGRTLGSGGRTLPTAGLIAQSGPVRSSPCETVAISRVNAQSLLGYLKTFGFASIHMACKSTHDCVMHIKHTDVHFVEPKLEESTRIPWHLEYFTIFPGYVHDIHRDSTTQPSPTCSFNGIGFAGADRGGGLASILQQQGE